MKKPLTIFLILVLIISLGYVGDWAISQPIMSSYDPTAIHWASTHVAGDILYNDASTNDSRSWIVLAKGTAGQFLNMNAGATAPQWSTLTLGTHTSGNYVKSITNGAGITGGDGGSEGAVLTLAATLGTAITGDEITDADYGDFTFSSGSATLNADVVGGNEIADADYGDFTFSSGSATLNADVVGGSEIADADYGDFTFSSGSATINAGSVAMGTDTTSSNWVTFYGDGSNTVQELANSTNAYVLTSQGTDTAPHWAVAQGAAGGDAWSDPVDSSLIPDTDDTYDVGSSTSQFKDGYFDGTLEADILTEGGNAVPNATDHLGFFGGTTSAQLLAEISDETGTGLVVFGTDPTFTDTITMQVTHDTALFAPELFLQRKRDGAPTDDVSSGDSLGYVSFKGYHTDAHDYAAIIKVLVDNTPGDDDMPGRFEFYTSADGSISPTLRVTIDSDGNVDLGADDNAVDLIIHSGGTQTWYDPSDNTSVTASVRDGTTVLDITGSIDPDVVLEGGNAVYNSSETPGGELGGTWASPTIDDDVIDFTEIVDNMTLDASTTINTDDKTFIIQASSTQTLDIFAIKLSTGSNVLQVENNGSIDLFHTATSNDEHHLELDTNAAGFGDIKSIDIDYITGAISAGEDEGIVLINIDETLATGGDVFAYEVLATDGNAAIYGLKVGALVGPVHQDSGTFSNPTTGTDNTISTDVADMIDGATNTTTAIFENDNEYILVCAAAAFQEIEFILTTGSSGAGIAPTFGYSIAGSHTYTTFSPVDGTNGFKNTGVVAWDASDLTSHVANDETTTFDIIVTRTRNSLGTTPILGYMKVASTTEYVWDKDGDVNIKGLTTTGVVDFGATTSTELVNDAAPTTNATGEIALDTTITDHQPLWQYYDGGENMTVIAVDTAQLPAQDNEAIIYDAGSDKFVLEAQAGAAGGDAWGDPVDAHIIPIGADDTYDVGSSTTQFRNGYFDGTLEADILTEGGVAVITEADMPAAGTDPDVDAAGEIGRDTNDHSLRGYSANIGQFVYGQATKTIQFTIAQPDDLDEKDDLPVFENISGFTFHIQQINAWCNAASATFALVTASPTNFDAETTVVSATLQLAGTGVYYDNILAASITVKTIQNGDVLIYDPSTFDAAWIKVSIIGYYDGDVN